MIEVMNFHRVIGAAFLITLSVSCSSVNQNTSGPWCTKITEVNKLIRKDTATRQDIESVYLTSPADLGFTSQELADIAKVAGNFHDAADDETSLAAIIDLPENEAERIAGLVKDYGSATKEYCGFR